MGNVLMGGFLGGIVARVPIGFALAASALIAIAVTTTLPLSVGPQRIVAGVSSYSLLAIPLFILAGSLMNSGGISRRLLDLAEGLVGRLRGGMAQTNVLSSLLFGGLSGSAVADVSSLGRILIPAMKERNYKAAYAAAVTAVAAVITPILPPSITLILYGVVTGTSIGQLFFAGLVPAFLYVAVLMVTVHLTVRRQGFVPGTESETVPAASGRTDGAVSAPQRERPPLGKAFLAAVPALFLPVLILVGIRGGFFTATEAAAVAVLYAFGVGVLIYRELTVERLLDALKGTVGLVGIIMLVMAAAQLFSWALTSERIPQEISSSLLGITENPVLMLLLINVLLLVVGMFIEANAAMIIIVPILMPVALSMGVDPLHLGIIVVVNLGLGLVTPPVGLTMMLSAEIAGENMLSTMRALVPFLICGGLYLLLITFVPAISLWLPNLLF